MPHLHVRLVLIAVLVIVGWSAALPSTPAALSQSSVEVSLGFYNISDQYNVALEEMVVAFEEAHPEITVDLQIRPIDQYWDKLQTEFAAGTAPDVTINQINWVIPGAARGMFVDLKPYMTRDDIDLDAYLVPHETEWGWQDGIYGGFSGIAGQALYVNKDLLAEAGLAFPEADWTWDDMVAYAQQLTDPAQNQWGLHIGALNPPNWGVSFIHGAGGTVLNDARDACTLTEPESQAGLQFLADLIHEEQVMPAPTTLEGQENPFLTGKVAMYFGGTWETGQVREAGFDWDFAHMPVNAETGIRSVQVATNAWSVLGSSEHEEEAWQLVKFLMGEGGANGLLGLTIPAVTSVLESEEFLDIYAPQNIEVVLSDYAEFGHDYYTTPDTDEWWSAVEQELSVVWSGEATVAEATERACSAVDEIFSRRPAEWGG